MNMVHESGLQRIARVRYLHEMRELLDRPGGWTQNATARDEDGEEVCVSEVPAPASFCLAGSSDRIFHLWEVDGYYDRCAIEDMEVAVQEHLEAAISDIYDTPKHVLVDFNDDETIVVEDVQDVLDYAGATLSIEAWGFA